MPKIQVEWIELQAEEPGILTRLPHAIEVAEGSTALEGLIQAGFPDAKARELISQRAVAVFGQYVHLNTVLEQGDRLEILDRLRFDPMESRRRRAAHKHSAKSATRKSGRGA